MIDFAGTTALKIPEGYLTSIKRRNGEILWQNNDVVVLEVSKIVASTYAGETTYENEEFLALNIYPTAVGATVTVTYGNLTKTLTFTGMGGKSVYFGTRYGVSDDVATPSSGILTISGDVAAFSVGTYTYMMSASSTKTSTGYCNCIDKVKNWGGCKVIQSYACRNCDAIFEIMLPKDVTSIGAHAFQNCVNLASIDVLDSVTSIDIYAFSGCSNLTVAKIGDGVSKFSAEIFYDCTNLQTLYLGENVTTISGTFTNCDNLTNVYIYNLRNWLLFDNQELPSFVNYYLNDELITDVDVPDGVTMIRSNAFANSSSLRRVNIPNTVLQICANAFSNCDKLTSVTLTQGLTKIDDAAFMASNLSTIAIPSGVTHIGSAAFRWNANLWAIEFPNTLTYVGKRVIHDTYYYNDERNWNGSVLYLNDCLLNGREASDCIVINGTRLIADSAFSGGKLQSITLPDSLEIICDNAFEDCYIKTIHIPAATTHIGANAFLQCDYLESINVAAGNPSYKSISGTLYNSQGTELILYAYGNRATVLTVPEGVTTIRDRAVNGSNRIKWYLQSIVLPGTLKSIGAGAFASQKSLLLTHDVLKEGLEKIERNAFALYTYDAVTHNITIPSTVTEMGVMPFIGIRLNEVIMKPTTPPTIINGTSTSGIFDSNYLSTLRIIVPKGCLDAYKTADIWSQYADYMTEA